MSASPTSNSQLGLYVMNMTPELREHLGAGEDRGVLVARVKPASPAALAGIEVGDVIVQVGGRDIDSSSDVVFEAAQATTRELPIEVIRDGTSIEFRATFSEEPRHRDQDTDWPAIDWMRQVAPIGPGVGP
ncbi:MAG: PDZ domain-containing protein [Kofleriaceae bacterium]|nr:PDZ domain-containing protein [Kofleriaceae bacterium]